MGNLCVIPARGGSKRIPRKNIKDFFGKPIIAYSIEAAVNSALFDEIQVSTDDKEIAGVAEAYGARVPFFRSSKNSDDFATTLDVLREVYSENLKRGDNFSNICCVYPTAPFVTDRKICEAYRIFIDNDFDSVLPIIKYAFPVQRSFKRAENGLIQYQFKEFHNHRSQDLKDSFHDAGQFYWMKSEVIHLESIITENTGAIEISQIEGQDIDNEVDWILAEAKYKMLKKI